VGMAAPRQGLPVRLERAPHRGAAFALSNASKRARTRSIGSRSRGSLFIFRSSPAIARIAKQADALFVVGEPLTFTHRTRINTLALAARLPTNYPTRGYVEVGGLMSYGPNFPASFRRAADYVHKILLGAKPGDLPVEQPTRYDLVVNLTTAKALGLTIPEAFSLRADEVIE
jgi:putative tryptophan/tyrosine transport system substrate-binding protein